MQLPFGLQHGKLLEVNGGLTVSACFSSHMLFKKMHIRLDKCFSLNHVE